MRNIVRNAKSLISGSLWANLITVISAPILTRLYLPEHFGTFGIFATFVALVFPLLTLRYTLAIPVPKSDSHALSLVKLSFVSAGLLLALLTALLSTPFLSAVLPESHGVILQYNALFIIAIAFFSTYEILGSWAIRNRHINTLTVTTVTKAFWSATSKILLGLSGIVSTGLLLGHVIQGAAGNVPLAKKFFQDMLHESASPRKPPILAIAKRYRQFPIYRLPSQALAIFCTKSPILFMAAIYDKSIAGQFTLALMLVSLPVETLSKNASKAFYAEIAGKNKPHSSEIARLYTNVALRLSIIAIAPAVAIGVIAPFIVPIIFGSNWDTAGMYVGWLTVGAYMMFVFSHTSHTLTIIEKNRIYLIHRAIQAATLLALFIFAFEMKLGPLNTVIALSVITAAHYATLGIYVFLKVRNA